jgi:hypothetical protein
MSLAYAPKCILDKIKKKCFSFLWTRKKNFEGIPFMKLLRIANSREGGGWGLKNI